MSCMSMWAGNSRCLHSKIAYQHMRCLPQALLAAVAAGPGGEGEVPAANDDAAELTERWHSACVKLVSALGSTISDVAEAGGDASALRQLGQLGVWRLLEQLVEATGAPCCAWMLAQALWLTACGGW